MTFKEAAAADIKNTFFNIDEFAEVHSVNGNDIPAVIDNDKMNELLNKFAPLNTVYEKMILFYTQKELLGFIPRINCSIMFDGEIYQIADVYDDGHGVLMITIGRNVGMG